ncbi:hypothetical protein RHGRI_023585 [Rhododendron griersonianum]|uniref:Uncharacterized protein n=1 Tax=Rhododendron griersonianum TaxID=479676 RepID=A0AAV6J5U4_9ERIC|nr:hypothetical protein RHGRI_023585 [Rhododendron griersonianum]
MHLQALRSSISTVLLFSLLMQTPLMLSSDPSEHQEELSNCFAYSVVLVLSKLSGKNLTGNIPLDLTKLSGLVELWLDGNFLDGPIPDFSGCKDLGIIHFENNQLTGDMPSSLAELPNLRELYMQNNKLFGKVPSGLLDKNLVLK